MKPFVLPVVASYLIPLVAVATAAAGELSYLGPGKTPGTAIVEDSESGRREIAIGQTVADLGALREVDRDSAMFELQVSEEEQEQLRERGLAAPVLHRFRLLRRPGRYDALSAQIAPLAAHE